MAYLLLRTARERGDGASLLGAPARNNCGNDSVRWNGAVAGGELEEILLPALANPALFPRGGKPDGWARVSPVEGGQGIE
jgi:hypothetical protein